MSENLDKRTNFESPLSTLVRNGAARIRNLDDSDLVQAYQCSCGQVVSADMSVRHALACNGSGRNARVPNPKLCILVTTHGPVVLELDGIPETPLSLRMRKTREEQQSHQGF